MRVKTLVVVEDDRFILGLIDRWGTGAGYQVTTFDRFEDARAYLSTHSPDVLVTDIRLGAFNGLQLAYMIRDTAPHAKTVVISGFEDPVLRADAFRSGAAYLQKPLKRDEFLAAIDANPPDAEG